ncbi:MAG: hypothetical protein AB7I44_13910 [Hyphomicrobiaceae bacterium]
MYDALVDFLPSENDHGEGLRYVGNCLRLSHDKSVSAFAKKLNAVAAQIPPHAENDLRLVVDELTQTERLLGILGAKPAAKDTASLLAIFSSFQAANRDQLLNSIATLGSKTPAKGSSKAAPVQIDVVDRYVRQLEIALGDEAGFKDVYRQLEKDESVRVGELSAIAKRFAFANVKTRSSALKKVKSRQDALMTSRAKSAATAGRIAG